MKASALFAFFGGALLGAGAALLLAPDSGVKTRKKLKRKLKKLRPDELEELIGRYKLGRIKAKLGDMID